MDSIARPIKQLYEDSGWFARAHELRLLAVQVSPELRAAAIDLLAKREFHADNFSPWIVLEDAHLEDDDGWTFRANRLWKAYCDRRDACAKDGIELPEIAAPSATSRGALALFGTTLSSVVRALRPPMRGAVVVLAPVVVGRWATFRADVEALITARELAEVRWVVLDTAVTPLPDLRKRLGALSLASECLIDSDAQAADLSAMLASAEASGAKTFGMARPRGVVPPKRVDAPPEIPKEQLDDALRARGIDPAYLERAPQLRQCLLGAALAMREKRGADAVRLQREARDICESLGLHRERVIAHLVLAGFLMALGEESMAVREYEAAARYASEHSATLQEAQARLALGAIHAMRKRLADAAREYSASARCAEAAETPAIAIEAWRLAGQLGLDAGAEKQAAECFQQALRVAGEAPADIQRTSSAAEAARTLAAACRKRGLLPQADALYAQAEQFEQSQSAAPAA